MAAPEAHDWAGPPEDDDFHDVLDEPTTHVEETRGDDESGGHASPHDQSMAADLVTSAVPSAGDDEDTRNGGSQVTSRPSPTPMATESRTSVSWPSGDSAIPTRAAVSPPLPAATAGPTTNALLNDLLADDDTVDIFAPKTSSRSTVRVPEPSSFDGGQRAAGPSADPSVRATPSSPVATIAAPRATSSQPAVVSSSSSSSAAPAGSPPKPRVHPFVALKEERAKALREAVPFTVLVSDPERRGMCVFECVLRFDGTRNVWVL